MMLANLFFNNISHSAWNFMQINMHFPICRKRAVCLSGLKMRDPKSMHGRSPTIRVLHNGTQTSTPSSKLFHVGRALLEAYYGQMMFARATARTVSHWSRRHSSLDSTVGRKYTKRLNSFRAMDYREKPPACLFVTVSDQVK